MALRGAASSGDSDAAVTRLLREHPALRTAILDAAMLNRAVMSTSNLNEAVDSPRRPMPGELGVAGPTGAPRYRLLERIGGGSQGEVFRAEDRVLSEAGHPALVAVKVLNKRRGDPYARQRFVEEATKARRVVDPNVVRVLDRGVSPEGDDFIVYEFVAGGDLGSLLAERGGRFSPREAATLMARVARGVHAAHTAGLVHRDLKPGNIMLTATHEPKVADFGIAVRIAPDSTGADATQQPVGNIAFTSPEQFRADEGSASPSSDVYALGGILYYLVSGQLPNGSTAAEVLRNHAPGGQGAPTARRPIADADRDLNAICRRALSVAAGDRHGSAAAFADDLEAWLRHECIPWTRPTVWRRLRLLGARRPLMSLSVLALIVTTVLGGAGAVYYWGESQDRETAAALERALVDQRKQIVFDNIATFFQREQMTMSAWNQLATQTLTYGLLTEWTLWQVGLDDPRQYQEFWKDRIRLAMQTVQAGREAPGRPAFSTLLWESTLCFWLTTVGRSDEALKTLERNRSDWAHLLGPDDPWVGQLDALAACAVISKAVSADTDHSLTPGLRERARAAIEMLSDDGAVFAGPYHATSTHRLALLSLRRAYFTNAFKDEAAAKALESRFVAVGMPVPTGNPNTKRSGTGKAKQAKAPTVEAPG